MIFGNLIHLGVKTDMEFYQERETRIVNLFALITLLGIFIGITTMIFIDGAFPTPIVLFITVSSIAILILNAKGLYNVATYVFVISINFSIFILNQQYQLSVGNYLYYFPLIFCIALLHNPIKTNARTLIFFGIILLSFFASFAFRIETLRLKNITESDNKILLTYNSFLTVFLTLLLVYLVVKLINRQNNDAIGLLKKEHEAQIKISQSLKEKEVLLAEIQHRVKNNLAIIAGLLNLQTEKAPCEVSRQLMIESKNRVMSIAMVHERLYKKDNLSKINLKTYLSELVQELVKSFPIKAQQIKIQEELDKIEIEITKAVPIGLIINEALTNSLKHAFNDVDKNPVVKIKMQLIYDRVQICVMDNGNGFSETQNRKDTALGLSLIESLADQIDASVVFKNENGACVSLVIPFFN
jgi:two-component sensor histidine kinase